VIDGEEASGCGKGNAVRTTFHGVREREVPCGQALMPLFVATASLKGNTMIAMEERPELVVRSGYEAELCVERTDILFHDVAGDRVRIEVTVHNAGLHRSAPTPMRIESAPLGAFVSWRPLTRLIVPPLEPGESRELTAEVKRPRPAPLGDFNRVPPKKLLTAVSSPDQPSRHPVTGFATMLFRKERPTRPSVGDFPGRASLAADLWDLAGRSQPYWAGNINVFIGIHAIERHRARALRVYPGRTNLAMFLVGDIGRRDAYGFELLGLAADWKAGLYDITNRRSLVVDPADAPIQERQWVESNGGLMVMLASRPPVGSKTGNLEVHVTRRSCQKSAIVEFNLDPGAQGTGCYFV